MSYVRFADTHDNGKLTEFRERLSGEVRMQTGVEFPIFQDRTDIRVGQPWQKVIHDSLDLVSILIPIIMPGFFTSEPCRQELERFLEREQLLGRDDLIVPVYYVDSPVVNDPAKRARDPLAKAIAARHLMDWRDLRFEPKSSSALDRAFASLAAQIREALDADPPAVPARPVAPPVAPPQASSGEAPTEEGNRGPSTKTGVPTHVVDWLGRGQYLTLSEALRAARPGDRILVRPGTYNEGLVIDKPIEIIGDSDQSECIIEASGKNVIRFEANMGRIANLTLRQSGGGRACSVCIKQGRLELADCAITSAGLSCVQISDGADPVLRRNKIHGGKEGGVFVVANGLGTLEDNDIYDNLLSGVMVKLGGAPLVRRNRIHGSKENGVLVYEGGRGWFEDNDIFENGYAGVEVRESGEPTLRRNRINHNGYQGIWVHKRGQGTFEENHLGGNKLGAWDVDDDCVSQIMRTNNSD